MLTKMRGAITLTQFLYGKYEAIGEMVSLQLEMTNLEEVLEDCRLGDFTFGQSQASSF